MAEQRLESLTWPEAERALREFPVAVLPLGAALKEHGYHLPLNNDWLLAEYLTERVLEQSPVVALPTVPYGYYPAFREYPGSTHIAQETLSTTVCDVCRSIARHSAARFYVLNTGVSTNWALEPARLALQGDGITMEYTNLHALLPDICHTIEEQPAGTHADEIETSMMLYIKPEVVRMQRAQRDIDPDGQAGPLTRDPDTASGTYSPTGAWGDPTLATREKGRVVTEAIVEHLVTAVEMLCGDRFQPAPPRQEYLELSDK